MLHKFCIMISSHCQCNFKHGPLWLAGPCQRNLYIRPSTSSTPGNEILSKLVFKFYWTRDHDIEGWSKMHQRAPWPVGTHDGVKVPVLGIKLSIKLWLGGKSFRTVRLQCALRSKVWWKGPGALNFIFFGLCVVAYVTFKFGRSVHGAQVEFTLTSLSVNSRIPSALFFQAHHTKMWESDVRSFLLL